MGKLLDLAKNMAGEKSLSGAFGRWILAVSGAGDQASGNISTLQTGLDAVEVDVSILQTEVNTAEADIAALQAVAGSSAFAELATNQAFPNVPWLVLLTLPQTNTSGVVRVRANVAAFTGVAAWSQYFFRVVVDGATVVAGGEGACVAGALDVGSAVCERQLAIAPGLHSWTLEVYASSVNVSCRAAAPGGGGNSPYEHAQLLVEDVFS